jgi:hypothetical protein
MPRRGPSKRALPKKGAISKKVVGPKVVGSKGVSPIEPPTPEAPEEPSKLEMLKGEILQLEAAANSDRVLARAQVGKKLIEVKVELKHGQWGFWLNDNLPLSAATAKRAIQLWHLSQNDPALFEALRPLGLTKAYTLMTMAPAEVEAFLSQAHAVPGAGTKTPLAMSFDQMMAVLHPPKPETKLLITTKLVKRIRRQTLGLGKLLGSLWKMVPGFTAKRPVKEALAVLAYELDTVADQLESKSLIDGNIPSFG